jgi:hypothetical protein
MTRHFVPSVIVAAALAALALAVPALAAQHGDQMAMPGMSYDKATETTITGTIDNVVEVPGQQPMSGVHLVLSTAEGTVHVHAGPATYLAAKKVSFQKGDKVQVIGSRIKGEGFEAILARQVKRGSQTVVLRDATGKPLW